MINETPNWMRDPRTPPETVDRWYDRQAREQERRKAVVIPNLYQLWRVYSKAFRGKPWDEMFKTPDGEFLGQFNKGVDLAQNGQWRTLGLLRAYPAEETTAYIRREITKPGSVVSCIENEAKAKKLEAGGWGYTINSATDLVEQKWKTAIVEQQRELSAVIGEFIGSQPLWYLSEVFVDPSSQGRGYGSQIVELLIQEAPNLPIIMRTNANSPMTVIARNAGFSQILGPRTYRDNGKIVVDANSAVNMFDPLNPDRVLYLLDKGDTNEK